MKTVRSVLLLVFLGASLTTFAETTLVSDSFSSTSLDKWMVVSGSWRAMNGRLYQTDTSEKMAMITIPVKQSGKILYEFDVRYVAGGEDNYAGFGIHFCASKAALAGITASLSKELGNHNIRVNLLAPGILNEGGSKVLPESLTSAYLDHCALGRFGTPQEVAEVVAWLAMENTYVTGQTILLDGGL